MKILCKLIRQGGTQVSLGSTVYSFMPDKDGKHVCDVQNENHINTLLRIKEAYEPYDALPDEPIGDQVTDDDLLGGGGGEDDGQGEGGEGEAVDLDPETMDNDQLAEWAKSRGINPKAKKSIIDYARDNYEEELDQQENVASLIRSVINLELAEQAEEEEAEQGTADDTEE